MFERAVKARPRSGWIGIVLLGVAFGHVATASAQPTTGKPAYERTCGGCHGLRLQGGAHAPALTGDSFTSVWGGRSADELLEYTRREMPPGMGGSLGEAVYRDIVTFIQQSSGGVLAELAPADVGPSEPGGRTTSFGDRAVTGLTSVTDAMLRAPSAGDWLTWRRTLDSHGYSPLRQVTPDNVGELRLAWVLSLREGNFQTTPIVHDGVMFLASPGNVVQAIDAASGDLIWEYRYEFPPDAVKPVAATRGLALYQDKVFLATYDAAIVALDTRTGEQVWRTAKAHYTQGFTHTGAPIIANGVVVSGINGC